MATNNPAVEYFLQLQQSVRRLQDGINQLSAEISGAVGSLQHTPWPASATATQTPTRRVRRRRRVQQKSTQPGATITSMKTKKPKQPTANAA